MNPGLITGFCTSRDGIVRLMRLAEESASPAYAEACAADGARLFPTVVGPRCPICGTAAVR